jgi:hypothetical protein
MLLAGSVLAAAIAGAVIGFVIEWPIALLAMRIDGAGYTNTPPDWDPAFATFDALLHGAPLGFILAAAARLLFFSRYTLATIAPFIPVLACFTLAGAIPGIWIGPGSLFTVVPTFLIGCIFVAYRLSHIA